ncbi:MAG: TetR/AcrR family transcriptional regulator [Bdellovibrionales bacterium]|jgi:AcrR family transcriptional regulator|nr:TetR/AcrR family transcriptional regulator [Bdellovibrionales bacterium]MBT3525767.1 TetR/AcrR family transcriptional regulator [Bdellovibrionales bacterium]MBT7668373.1 TetR/AcrR family transcriptional regulator [Bdellovibrionales bacterium]
MGFESVSIASLAKEVGMSKSGLFAHFNSKEKMHLMILDHAADKFAHDIFRISLKSKRGLPRLRLIVKNWLSWFQVNGGGTCPFLAAAVEYDSRPGLVKDRIQLHIGRMIKSLNRSIDICVEEGEFVNDLDTKKATYEIYSLIVGQLVYLRTIEHKTASKMFKISFEELINRYSV